eukprot:CAMPEP_0194505692 /NCGR_PEP_ID=MMETSP0253-20130528/32967_1 /TAXON_ID=2966 /ORGANISM="Noctiluca scintillans" /LENGTH=673 /DNA_ID=CAMNT_0039348293 /DNA_START=66 /DNA_END=2087 /DNA_ORIENTATION=-
MRHEQNHLQAHAAIRGESVPLTPLQVGDTIQYWSSSTKRFYTTKVTAVDAHGSIQIAVKPNVWIDMNEQRTKVVHVQPKLSQRPGTVGKIADLGSHSAEQAKNLQYLLRDGAEEEIKQVALGNFDKFDGNGNGRLEYGEYTELCRAVHTQLKLAPPNESNMRKLFDSYDIDHDGVIEKSEFPSAFRRLIRWTLAGVKCLELSDLVHTNLQSFDAKYALGKRLGAGAMGVAYFATERATGRQVVVKKNKNPTDREDFDKVRNLSHPNVIKVIEVFTRPEICIVSEFCGGGDLFGCLEYCHAQKFGITYQFFAHVMSHAMRGVHYLHSTVRICHNDIKPDNIFLDRKPEASDFKNQQFPRFIVADFGLARAMGLETSGDPRYKPPEVYTQNLKKATVAGDIWALGVTQFELLSGGKLIYTNHRNLGQWDGFLKFQNGILLKRFQQGIMSGQDPNWQEIAGSSRAMELTKRLLARDPRARLGLQSALEHSFFDMLHEDVHELDASVAQGLAHRSNMTNLKMTLLNMVALKLHGDAVAHFEELWNRFDLDKSGALTVEEFVKVARASDSTIDDAHATEMFKGADLDSTGSLNFLEFMGLMVNTDALTSEQLAECFKSLFSEVCTTSGGLVTANQFLEKFPSAIQQHQESVKSLFNNIDTNNDGSIDETEFVDFIDSM